MCVGGVKGPLAEGVEEYERRCRHYWRLEIAEVSAGARGRSPTADQVRAAEGQRLEAALAPDLAMWALTREGKGMNSSGLAAALGELGVRGEPGLNFVIGGAFGLDASLISRAARMVSLTEFTLPHELARLVLAEQLYRAGTILRGEPYHKGPGGQKSTGS